MSAAAIFIGESLEVSLYAHMIDAMPISQRTYSRPPITECVLELRFESPPPLKDLEAVQKKLLSKNPVSETITEHNFQFPLVAARTSSHPLVGSAVNGFKMTNLDGTEIVIVSKNSIATSYLAPYPGWLAFRAAAERNWNIASAVLGYQKVSRLGLRYLNRIDVPIATDTLLSPKAYLNVYVEYPDSMPPMSGFAFNTLWDEQSDGLTTAVNVATVPSPVPHHSSFLLDIDIGRNSNVPAKEGEIWATFDAMRERKNEVFELSVTESSRVLFQ